MHFGDVKLDFRRLILKPVQGNGEPRSVACNAEPRCKKETAVNDGVHVQPIADGEFRTKRL